MNIEGNFLKAAISLDFLSPQDLKLSGRKWCIIIPADLNSSLKIVLEAKNGEIIGQTHWYNEFGRVNNQSDKTSVEIKFHDAFSTNTINASIEASIQLSKETKDLDFKSAWVETYDDITNDDGYNEVLLSDIAPYDHETNAKLVFHPEKIATTFKRIV